MRAEVTEELLATAGVFPSYVFRGIEQGMYTPPTAWEVRKIIQTQWEQTIPLLQLPPTDEHSLKAYVIAYAQKHVKDAKLFALCGPTVFVPKAKNVTDIHALFDLHPAHSYLLAEPWAQQAQRIFHLSTLTPKEKLSLVTEPSDMEFVFQHTGSRVNFRISDWSARAFFSGEERMESYHISREKFSRVFSSVKARTGSNELTLGDIGSSSGRALHDVEKFCREFLGQRVKTVGFSLDEELAMYPVDAVIIGPMERVPKTLFERIDILVSSRAFEYFTYPDVGLYNALLMLKPGGWMLINFAWEDSILHEWRKRIFYPNLQLNYQGLPLETRIQHAIQALQYLQERNFIEIPHKISQDPSHEFFEITKVKSIPPEFFQPYLVE